LTAVFERFTEQARHVVVMAQDEARGLGHNYIGTEHLLLGLIYPQGGIADQTIARFGLTAESVRDQIAAIVESSEKPVLGRIPFTPRAKKVLELGMREALNLGHNHIDTEHLLLGLLPGQEGIGTRVLSDSGIDIEALREAVIERAHALPRVHTGVGRASAGPGPRAATVRRVEPAVRITVTLTRRPGGC
jgi:ATP-dependent Clp protease ATP-binding subunit ClpC